MSFPINRSADPIMKYLYRQKIHLMTRYLCSGLDEVSQFQFATEARR